jgi:hypothetical protein
MDTDFSTRLDELAQRLVDAAAHCRTEEAAKFSLVAPFIEFLGYDVRDPRQVQPEHAADFSEKYRNRVDFALIKDGVPVMAIECKSVGNSRADDRGQLKAYFNASQPVKVGVLTDGLVWEFFADCDEPNIMDDNPFLLLDLRQVALGKAIDPTYDALEQLTRERFRPDEIGSEASRRLLFQGFVRQIAAQFSAPTADFCRLLMKAEGVKNVREPRMPEYKTLVSQAIHAVLDAQILQRLNIHAASVVQTPTAPQTDSPTPDESRIVTSGAEMAAYLWAKSRLAFLSDSEEHYRLSQQLEYRDFQTKFVVYLGGERRGRLFDFIEGREKHRFVFAHNNATIETNNFADVDAMLTEVFTLRASELRQLQ